MTKQKVLFLDRDGTLIDEPKNGLVDSLDRLKFIPGVFSALKRFQTEGFSLVMVSNQNGIGRPHFPEENFKIPHQKMLDDFSAQGITFDAVLICPHMADDGCTCRKPKTGLVDDYIKDDLYDHDASYFMGDRATDLMMAEKMGIKGIQLGQPGSASWEEIADIILPRAAL